MELSERELASLRGYAKGTPVKTIGRNLDVSEHTVREYLRRAARKLGVSTTRAAALVAASKGLIDLSSRPK